jgi:hypothetical protein
VLKRLDNQLIGAAERLSAPDAIHGSEIALPGLLIVPGGHSQVMI